MKRNIYDINDNDLLAEWCPICDKGSILRVRPSDVACCLWKHETGQYCAKLTLFFFPPHLGKMIVVFLL